MSADNDNKHTKSGGQGKQKKRETVEGFLQLDIFGNFVPVEGEPEQEPEVTAPPPAPPLTLEQRQVERAKKRRRRGVISLEEARNLPQSKRLIPRRMDYYDRVGLASEIWHPSQYKVGFLGRMFTQVGVPHRSPPKDATVWYRRNGNLMLVLQPRIRINPHTGEVKCYGFPFGNLPRLILIYLCTMALQLKSRQIPLGESMADFMREIGLEPAGGSAGRRFKNQLLRLLNCNIAIDWYETSVVDGREVRFEGSQDAQVASRYALWWDDKAPEQGTLFESHVVLNEAIYNEILAHPVPLDLATIATFRRSPLALDLYSWLSYRVFGLSRPAKIPWHALEAQVGSQYNDTDNFKKKAKRILDKMRHTWKGLDMEYFDGGIIIRPSKLSVPYVPPKTPKPRTTEFLLKKEELN